MMIKLVEEIFPFLFTIVEEEVYHILEVHLVEDNLVEANNNKNNSDKNYISPVNISVFFICSVHKRNNNNNDNDNNSDLPCQDGNLEEVFLEHQVEEV